jgi:ribosome recycling factor
VRREGNEMLKSLEKQKEISEDDWRRGQEQVQKITDRYITKTDEILSAKEHEVMEV